MINLDLGNKILIIALTLVGSFLISAITTGGLIPFLKRHQFGQFIREEGPEAHKSKAGTPTMGGIAMVLAIVVSIPLAMLIYSLKNGDAAGTVGMIPAGSDTGLNISIGDILAFMLTMIAFALIGFIDDYNKIAKKENEGLTPKQKILLQVVLSAGLAIYMMKSGVTSVYIPFAKTYVEFGILYPIFIVFIEIAMANSVNLTDGLDGLASSVTAIVALLFAFVGLSCPHEAFSYTMWAQKDSFLVIAGFAVAGACIGFFVHNHFPAKIFMGDTGSMALGGALAAMAIIGRMEFLLPIAGLIYVIEALSVIIQVTYFKKTGGKRIFRMAPIHHHFELGGMHESKVVLMFAGFTILMSIIAFCGA